MKVSIKLKTKNEWVTNMWIIVLIILALIDLGISIYNQLISSREFVRNSMGNIAPSRIKVGRCK